MQACNFLLVRGFTVFCRISPRFFFFKLKNPTKTTTKTPQTKKLQHKTKTNKPTPKTKTTTNCQTTLYAHGQHPTSVRRCSLLTAFCFVLLSGGFLPTANSYFVSSSYEFVHTTPFRFLSPLSLLSQY